jgi:polyisoprenoid-binding protein YceI
VRKIPENMKSQGMRRPFLAVFACAAALASDLTAQAEVLQLDPERTRIEFTLPAALHTVHGSFKLRQGEVRFDPAGGSAGGQIVVSAASGETGNKGRDRKMQETVLESRKYPDVTFTPARIDGRIAPAGESRVVVQGTLSLHGVEHEIAVPVLVRVDGDQLTAAAHFAVPYVAWGLKNPSTFVLRVSPKVDIDLYAAGRLLAGP